MPLRLLAERTASGGIVVVARDISPFATCISGC
jgi:hypothetical protein